MTDFRRTILVTGNRGYIGSVLTQCLLGQSYTVIGLDTMYYHGCEIMANGKGASRQIVGDIRDFSGKDLEGVQAVIHLAGLSNDPLGEMSSSVTREVNHAASVRLASLAKSKGVERFVFASTCSVYGIAADDRPVSESSPINPITEYAKSKALVEQDVRALADSHYHPVFLRSATVYGFSPQLRLDLVVNNMVAWAYLTGKVVVMSDGSPWRPLLHVHDLCQAIVAILEAPLDRVSNETFNVGSDHANYKVSDIAETVRQVVPNSTVEVLNQAGPDQRSYRVDFRKITSALNFMPVHTLRTGVEELYRAYGEWGLVKTDLDSSKYFRQRRIKDLLGVGRLDKELQWTRQSLPV